MAATELAFPTRVDGVDKVTGAATYAADITRPGMLWGRILRSPLPHARIVSIDTVEGEGAARRARRADRRGPARALAGRARHAGHAGPGAGTRCGSSARRWRRWRPRAARSPRRRSNLIEVEYEELPAVFDPVEAMQPGAPLIHEPEDVRACRTPTQIVADYPNSVLARRCGASAGGGRGGAGARRTTCSSTPSTPRSSTRATSSRTAAWSSSTSGASPTSGPRNKAPFLLLDYLAEGLGLPASRSRSTCCRWAATSAARAPSWTFRWPTSWRRRAAGRSR